MDENFEAVIVVTSQDGSKREIHAEGVSRVVSERPPEKPEPPEQPEFPDMDEYLAPVLHQDVKGSLTLNLGRPNHIVAVAGPLVVGEPQGFTGQGGHIEFHNPDGHFVTFEETWQGLSKPLDIGAGRTLLVYYVSPDTIFGTTYLTEDAVQKDAGEDAQ